MATRMQQRRGTAAEWSTANPVLAAGEIGVEIDTKILKVGDGTTSWNNLASGHVRTRGGDVIIASGVAVTPLVLRGAPGQTADIGRIETAAGAGFRVSNTGEVFKGTSPLLNRDESDVRFLGRTAKAADADLLDGIDSTGFVRTVGGSQITASAAGVSPLRLKLASGQTAPGFELRNNTDGMLVEIDSAGTVRVGGNKVVLPMSGYIETVGVTARSDNTSRSPLVGETSTLGGTAGNISNLLALLGNTGGSQAQLRARMVRTAAGTDHTTTRLDLYRLVDATEQARITFEPSGDLFLTGNVNVAGIRTIILAPGGVGGWDSMSVKATTLWGDGVPDTASAGEDVPGATRYITIGAGGAHGVMVYNPHVVWHSGAVGSYLRLGRFRGKASGHLWDAGFWDNGAFPGQYELRHNGNSGLFGLDSGGNLKVAGQIRAGAGAGRGFTFPIDPGGGSGDAARIEYVVKSGEATRLQIIVENDPDDDILLDASGGVSISARGFFQPAGRMFQGPVNFNVNSNGSTRIGNSIGEYALGINTPGGGGSAGFLRMVGNDGPERAYLRWDGHWFAAGYNGISARKTKDNIKTFDTESMLDRVKKARPVSFTPKDGVQGNRRMHSFVAEELALVLPEVTAYDADDNPAGINLNALGTLTFAMVQNLISRIEKLEGSTPVPAR